MKRALYAFLVSCMLALTAIGFAACGGTQIKQVTLVDWEDKTIEVDLYSKRDVFLGRKYIQIENLEQGQSQAFEMLFKLQDVSSYKISIVDERMDGVVCPYYYTTDSLLHTDPLFESLFAVTFESKDNVAVIKRIHLIPQ